MTCLSRPLVLTLALALTAAAGLPAQTAWRFGWEDTWSQLGGLLGAEDAELLLGKMAAATEAQAAGGDVNVNGLAGGWASMQASEGAPINFTQSDFLVQRLQAHGFSLQWELRLNAAWASADNPDCYDHEPSTHCGPGPAHEDDLYDYVHAIVERYDGDGFEDMGWQTPGDPADDLLIPVRFYLMQGEIEFTGATPPPEPGYGDASLNHFWSDSISSLLNSHRIVWSAVHDADASGGSQVVSSGGVFWDLYGDFPDYPEPTGETVQARLLGTNNHGAQYIESFQRIETLLTSFGDDSDGIETDYLGWHPHMPWREIDQTFNWIRSLAGDKPIYVDDMWCNIFLEPRADAPGATQFTGGGAVIEGDFPNELAADYQQLYTSVIFTDGAVRAWYYGRHSRHLVKAFVSAFGEGAERVSVSGNADLEFLPIPPIWVRGSLLGRINLMGTAGEGFFEKPAYWTYRLLVDKLHDFTAVTEIPVSTNPLTRVYRFDRPRGPVWIGWSETGGPPPGLDYDVATGETVGFAVGDELLLQTHVVDEPGQSAPELSHLSAPGEIVTLQLGYEPVILEVASLFKDGFESGDSSAWSMTVP